MSNLTTTSDVDPAVATYYDRILLTRALPELIYELFAQKRPLPKKGGNTIKFRRYSALTKATTPKGQLLLEPQHFQAVYDVAHLPPSWHTAQSGLFSGILPP